MYLGEVVEFDKTDTIFFKPRRKENRGLHHRPLRLTGGHGDSDERPYLEAVRRPKWRRSAAACSPWEGSSTPVRRAIEALGEDEDRG